VPSGAPSTSASLALDHVPLQGHRRAQAGAIEQEAHTRALEPQGQLEAVRGQRLVENRLIVPGRAVALGGARLIEEREDSARRDVLGAVEHEVLEEVDDPGAAGRLVARADVVPGLDVHRRHLVIDVQDDLEAVWQRELLERDLDHPGGHLRNADHPGHHQRGSPHARHLCLAAPGS
jgi:hypothetical protein